MSAGAKRIVILGATSAIAEAAAQDLGRAAAPASSLSRGTPSGLKAIAADLKARGAAQADAAHRRLRRPRTLARTMEKSPKCWSAWMWSSSPMASLAIRWRQSWIRGDRRVAANELHERGGMVPGGRRWCSNGKAPGRCW